MLKTVSKALILLACGVTLALAFQEAPPKELIQYVRDALKSGQNAFQIQENAVNSGWPLTAVTQAMTFVHDQDATAPAVAAPTPEDKGAASPAGKPATTTPAADGNNSAAATPPAGGIPPAAAAKPGETAKPAPGTVKPETINRGVPDDYKIDAGDVIEINVWKEPDASVHGAIVRTDGKISMPLLKEVEVVGLTPVQLEKLITDKLTSLNLLTAPDVTIIVTGMGSKKIYFQGKVNKEGPIPFMYNMTVMQALSEAGGLNPYAHKNKIYILRTVNGKSFKLPFDYTAVLRGQRMELNIQVQAGDWIIVP